MACDAGLVGACLLLGMRLSPQDSAAKAIATDRYEAAKEAWALLTDPIIQVTDDCETRVLWSRRLAEAAAECGALPARDAFAQHLVHVEELMRTTKILADAFRRPAFDVPIVRFHLAEAKGLAAQSAKK